MEVWSNLFDILALFVIGSLILYAGSLLEHILRGPAVNRFKKGSKATLFFAALKKGLAST